MRSESAPAILVRMTTTVASSWFIADKEGLGEQTARRSPAFVIYELFQNAADEAVTRVEINLSPSGTRGLAFIQCVDDSPLGFEDLADTFTLFKRSKKADDPTRRGRFNSGEKYVLSRCAQARIESTKGTVVFKEDGTREVRNRERIPVGSVFTANVKMNQDEVRLALREARQIIVPDGITFILNGEEIEHRKPFEWFEAKALQTEVDFRPTRRNTRINLYQPLDGETPTIYEMGIPVVEHDGPYHIDVQQCVPLNSDRDNVTPAYLRALHALVLEHTALLLSADEAGSGWVKDAINEVTPEVARDVFIRRFGKRTVIADPSDREATKRLMDKGYTILSGRSLTSDEWAAAKRAEVFQPAGRVLPSGIGSTPDGVPPVPEGQWTPSMRYIAVYAEGLGKELLGFTPRVKFYKMPFGQAWDGCWGGGCVSFNMTSLGAAWFDNPTRTMVDELLLHEFTHHKASDHLSDKFHRETTRLGALLRDCKTDL